MMKKLNEKNNKSDYFKEKWNELFIKPLMEKEFWKTIAIFLMVVVIVLSVGLVRMIFKDNLVIGIIEVDQTGKAVVVGQAQKSVMKDDVVIRGHLYRFIEMARSIITDPEAMRTNFTRVYKMVTPEVKNFLNIHYRENNPMEQGREKSRQIILSSFLKHSDNTFLVEWNEIERDLSNKVIQETKWKALMTITQDLPSSYKEMEDRPFNPFGIYIKSLSWSKVL